MAKYLVMMDYNHYYEHCKVETIMKTAPMICLMSTMIFWYECSAALASESSTRSTKAEDKISNNSTVTRVLSEESASKPSKQAKLLNEIFKPSNSADDLIYNDLETNF
jgi:hypothetical protein